MQFFLNRNNWKSTTLVVLFPLLYLILLFANGRFQMSDFNVYYGAAEALRNTDQVYGIAFGLSSGYYKYSPEALVLFLPFSYLSYNLAAICYYLFTVFIFLGIISELKSLAYRFELNERKAEWFTVFILLLGADFIEREFFLGNVNALILYLLLLTARWANSKQEIKAGILVGIVLVLKVHFVILIPYLIWKKQWQVLKGIAVAGLFSILVFICLVGERILPLHLQWLKAIQDHNVQLAFSPNTIYANITKLLGYFHVVYNPTALVTVMLFFVSSIFFIWIYKRKRQGVSFKEWAVLICLIPILMHTDTEHFMWSLPFFFIFLIGLNRSSEKLIRCLGLIYIVILSIPFTFNSPDLVGKIWSKRFDEGGIGLAVQFSLILVLGLETVKYLKNKRITSSS